MFEGCLVESRGLPVSATQRWTALGSLTFQLTIAGLLLAIPLVRPQVLPPYLTAPPRLELPVPMKPPEPVVQTHAASGPAAQMAMPAAAQPMEATQRFEFHRFSDLNVGPAPPFDPNLRMGTGEVGGRIPGLNIAAVASGPAVTVAPEKKAGPLHVSGGVTAGMLLAPIQPVYPAIAKATRTEGTVVMEALISKAGRIESVHVVSGPQMLQRAAVEAVKAARYRPYLLTGEPVEVQTTITVVFRLGS